MTSSAFISNPYLEQQHDKDKERANKLVAIQGKVASVLCLRPIETSLVEQAPYPVWSGSASIGYSMNGLGDLTDPYAVMSAKGATIHEIGHILFTPRAGSSFRSWVIEQGFHKAFIYLEDCRTEYLMIGRYGSNVAGWLNASVIRHLVQPTTDLSTQYPLFAGRTYVSVAIREALRTAFVRPDLAGQIQALVLEYRQLVFDRNEATDTAKAIITEFHQLLLDCGRSTIADPFGHYCRPTDELETSNSRPLPHKDQHRAKASADKRNEPLDTGEQSVEFLNPYAELRPPTTPTGSGCELGQGQSQGKGQGQGREPGDEQGQGKGQGNDPGNEQGQGVSRKGNAEWKKALNGLLRAELRNQYDLVKSEVRKDIRTMNGYNDLVAGKTPTLKSPRRVERTKLEPEVFANAKKFGQELVKIRTENEPGWLKRTENGKLHAGRYLTGCDLDTAFDQYTPGQQEATDLEVVVLLDNSGSMGGSNAEHAYRAMFAIKKGLEAINANCSVIIYNSYAEQLYTADEKVGNVVKDAGAYGGTNPEPAVDYAHAVFANSTRSVKVLITITDGEWGNTPETDDLVAELRQAGVLTSFAFIGAGKPSDLDDFHNFELITAIQTSNGLLTLAKDLVKLAINRKLTATA